MTRTYAVFVVLMLAVPARAQNADVLAGSWSLDRAASQIPREVGFDASFLPAGGGDASRDDGRGGSRRGGGTRSGSQLPFNARPESVDDATRLRVLTGEVRTPPSRLAIVESGDAVTITPDGGNGRTFHPDGRAETLRAGDAPVLTTARREAGRLVVLYAVEDLRQLRYTFSRSADPDRLIVDVQFLDRGRGDTVRLVYQPAASTTPGATATADARTPGTAPAPLPPSPSAPASGARTPAPRAAGEFAGLTRIGLTVEALGQQAVSCGLSKERIESAVMQPFAAAGLRIVRDADDDTYVYVSIQTATQADGTCISRYDVSVDSMTETTLSHQRTPVLAQVSLAHKGGLSVSRPPAHAADVLRAIGDAAQQFAGRIRDANR